MHALSAPTPLASLGLSLAAALWLVLGLIVLGPRKSGYSAWRHSISELGEQGSPLQSIVAWGLFLPIGLLLLPVALLQLPLPAARLAAAADALAALRAAPAAALALCIAVGYLGAALFPCEPGSPLVGGLRQTLHKLGGAVQYAGGGFALLRLGEGAGQPFTAAGALVLAATLGLALLPPQGGRGLVQRVAEAALFGGPGWAVGA